MSIMNTKLAERHDMTEEQVADLKEAFAMFDINGDGKHSLEEEGDVDWSTAAATNEKEREALQMSSCTASFDVCSFKFEISEKGLTHHHARLRADSSDRTAQVVD